MTKAKAQRAKAAVKTSALPQPIPPHAVILDMRARNPTPMHQIIGNRIRQLRVSQRISQQALGEMLGGISFQQIQKYEKGVNRLDAARLLQIAEALEVDIMDIYGDLTKRRLRTGVSEQDRYRATAEGQRLLDAMTTIQSDKLRRPIVRLAEAIANASIEEADGEVEADDE